MNERRALVFKCDDRFRAIIIERAGLRCEECGATNVALECAHVIARRHLRVRWNPLNAVCLCVTCHLNFTMRPDAWTEWCRGRLGSETFMTLSRIAWDVGRRVDVEDVDRKLSNVDMSGLSDLRSPYGQRPRPEHPGDVVSSSETGRRVDPGLRDPGLSDPPPGAAESG